MGDEVVLQYLKSIDDRTARMEDAQTIVNTEHDKRIKSLENSRTAARAGIAALTLGSSAGAAKLGAIDKLMSLFGSGGQ